MLPLDASSDICLAAADADMYDLPEPGEIGVIFFQIQYSTKKGSLNVYVKSV